MRIVRATVIAWMILAAAATGRLAAEDAQSPAAGDQVDSAAASDLSRIRDAIDREQAEVAVAEIIEALRTAGTPSSDAGTSWISWLSVFSSGCERAAAQDMPALIELFEAIPSEEYLKHKAFAPLADAWLRVRLAEHPIPRFWRPPADAGETPPEVEKLPAALQDAWRTYHAAIRLPPKPEPQQCHDFLTQQGKFWAVISDLLAGRGGPWAAELERYAWNRPCGTSSGRLFQPRDQAILLALVAENRLPEALAAALTLDPEDSRGAIGLELIRRSGIDWQAAFIGRLVTIDLKVGRRFVASGSGVDATLQALVAEADDAGLHMLVDVARLVPPDRVDGYVDALTALAPPIESEFDTFEMSSFTRRESPVGRNVQLEILAFCNDVAGKKLPVSTARRLLGCLETWCRPETRPGLRRLVDHPSETVANRAARLLEEMGEKVVVPPKAPPVRYRMVVNGKPAAGLGVAWTLTGRLGIRCSTADADADGVITLSRDDFLDPEDWVQSVEFRCTSFAEPGGTWFFAALPPPAADGKVVVVEFTTGPFSLLLPRPAGPAVAEDATMEVKMRLVDEQRAPDRTCKDSFYFHLPVAGRVDFGHLMAGTYEVTVKVPGCVDWKQNIEVSPGKTFTVPLAPADRPPDTNQIKSLTPEQARRLVAEFGGGRVEFECGGVGRCLADNALPLNGLTTLDAETAGILAACGKPWLLLDGLATIPDDALRALAEFQGAGLSLDGLKTLSPAAARILAGSRCRKLSLNGVTAMSAEAAHALAGWDGGSLALNGLATLSPAVARAIAGMGIKGLSLNGLIELPAESARALATWKGFYLSLDGLTTLTPDAAEELAGFKGPGLTLDGVTALSKDTATALAGFNGNHMSLDGVTTLSADVAEVLVRAPAWDGSLDGVTALEAPDSVSVAVILASREGPLSIPNIRKLSPKALAALMEKEDIKIPPVETLELIREADDADGRRRVIP